MNFDVSQSAARRISELIKNEPDSKVAIRVAVDSGGCSGFMYDYNLIDKVNDDDFILEKYGVKIAIDPLSQPFLDKCKLEFVEELGSAYFQISNPNAIAKCGCGNSFNV
ncbi:MAG: iron-sulfur cluster assembly accessory protein [Alphaproteobacteria bacterium]|nr:iron-sulfur cluster assembly accessory protein [Rickettsiales bacterium]MCE2730574.1 iron-sulfur cluster assembly accessory protein [Rickettsiaceae bacterium]NBY35695.1 iron-sulfur cluster assembly accessory protein [Alphaproteobacteria bacterium]UCM94698.1 MAG: iron-sulfur cluster assembly accessory protein [Candidatus Megaira endosymbiont of Mesostigma viride]HJK88160.1 iron-sulfur cluster assembly accessory protein [Candidatus Megaira endosymbiont of Mesostigma viride]